MALETKDHILGAKLDIVAVPYFTVFGFLQESSLCDLTLYGTLMLRWKTFFMILGERL